MAKEERTAEGGPVQDMYGQRADAVHVYRCADTRQPASLHVRVLTPFPHRGYGALAPLAMVEPSVARERV